MIPTRFVPGQAPRKSRMEGRQSFLPRRLGSTDRLSDSRRPSGTGPRSSSAEPARASVAVGRLSRDSSATKLPLNRRSRSQQGAPSYGQPTTTPLRGNQYPRPTTTPVRTPSGDRSRSWEACLDRALACVTVKDSRPIANIAWQRAELSRVQEALAARGDLGAGLVRPLTITRFVDICRALLAAITGDDKLNNDNYVAKLPHMCKRLLYPGTVSKSWLKAVNTLHAFPQALALIAYLLDLLRRIESPVSDEWLYVNNDDHSRLRRDYLKKCFIRFQTPHPEFDDLTEEYLQQLKQLLGTDDDKKRELEEEIKQQEQALAEERESSACARANESARLARRDGLLATLRATRLNIQNTRAKLEAARAEARDKANEIKAVDAEIARATVETAQLRKELESQPMSVEERGRLLDDVDYAARVYESKRVLADQIAKMVHSRETELALWQKKTLDSCVEVKQGLIHLSAHFPQLATLALDETKLMDPSSLSAASSALEALKQLSSELSQRRAQLARSRSALATQRQAKMEEARASIAELKGEIQAAQRAREEGAAADAAAEAAAARREAEAGARLRAFRDKDEDFRKVHEEMLYWKRQDEAWRAKLSAMHEYIRSLKEKLPAMLEEAQKKRVDLVAQSLRELERDSGFGDNGEKGE